MPSGGCWEGVLTQGTPGLGAQTRLHVPRGDPQEE